MSLWHCPPRCKKEETAERQTKQTARVIYLSSSGGRAWQRRGGGAGTRTPLLPSLARPPPTGAPPQAQCHPDTGAHTRGEAAPWVSPAPGQRSLSRVSQPCSPSTARSFTARPGPCDGCRRAHGRAELRRPGPRPRPHHQRAWAPRLEALQARRARARPHRR